MQRDNKGSVLSPFLFNLVLAPLIECLPSAAPFPVRAVIYADDIALYVRGPTRQCSRDRNNDGSDCSALEEERRAAGNDPLRGPTSQRAPAGANKATAENDHAIGSREVVKII
ncbi:hypothetical protein HPB50_014851 [Hyalomma asiaticum]|uniref:Uncharacterized protein n=1 Tax=Hyalomma asiaticum TaxID=266040 RepID=A0ACB7RKX0_HYAAI|nr:hypothetical protein HPB50_014851 [Hyalomma asiaticum]